MDDLERAFADERAVVAQSLDPAELLCRLGEYRRMTRSAVRDGAVRSHQLLNDLIDQTEARVTELKVEALRRASPDDAARSNVPPPPPRSAQPADPSGEERRQAERRRAEEDREAALRNANRAQARAAELARQAQAERLRAQRATLPTPVRPPSSTPLRSAPRPAVAPRPAAAPLATGGPSPRPGMLAPRASTVAAPVTALVASTVAAPVAAPLTGRDLLELRTRLGLTQRSLAARLGVAPGTVAKAEGTPARPLGEALQGPVGALRGAGGG